MNSTKQVLSNGLRVLTVPMPTLESVTVCVWVKTGSRNEEKRINGISHFLEHMAFKGSKKRPTAKAISEVIDSIGGEFNAGTSKEYTNFYVKCGVDNVEVAFDILSDMVINPILDENEIEREKGTIVEEIKMYEDTPMMKIGDVFEELIYSGNSLGWEIAGDEKSVRSIKKNDFVSYRKAHFYAENMLVTVSGGVAKENVNSLSKKYFSDLKSGGVQKHPPFDKFSPTQSSPQIKLHSKKKEQAHFIMGFLADGKNYKNKYAQTVLATILGGGMSSRMFLEVRERRGLAYSVRTSMDRYTDIGYMGTYVGADINKADEAVKVVLDEHYGVANDKKPITKAELTKAKEFIKGHLALALEDTRSVGSFFSDQELFLPQVNTPDEVFDKVDKVKLEEVAREAKRLFVPERLNLALIGPFKSKDKFAKIIN
ncbi:insulinase family protein [Candidatus Microgenomates bacterium]|nr:insulinase family protein [Candidatus Microgenomates bacterium]